MLFLLCFFISSPNLSGRRLDVCHTSTQKMTWCGLSANLECRSEMCCTWLGENTGRKNDAKNRYLGTIPQLCQAISSQLSDVSTIGKKNWDPFGSLGHPSYFQRLPRLGSVTAWQSSNERQPNFAGLNRGPHLCSAARPSRWALAHISSFFFSSNLSHRRLDVYYTSTHGVALVRILDADLKPAACSSLKIQDAKSRQNSPSGHHRTTLSGYIFATKARIDNRNKTC